MNQAFDFHKGLRQSSKAVLIRWFTFLSGLATDQGKNETEREQAPDREPYGFHLNVEAKLRLRNEVEFDQASEPGLRCEKGREDCGIENVMFATRPVSRLSTIAKKECRVESCNYKTEATLA